MATVVNKSDWSQVAGFLDAYDTKRELIIKRCRDSQKLAKHAVYSLHRGDIAQAAKQLQEVEGIAQELLPVIQQHPSLRAGSYAASMEEYAEAQAFLYFLREGRLVAAKELPLVEPEEYLGGILDMTGELNRYAVLRATARDTAAVARCRDLVDSMMGKFLQLNLRNGNLRKKYDVLKYTLKKLENTLYELSLTSALGVNRAPASGEEEAMLGVCAQPVEREDA